LEFDFRYHGPENKPWTGKPEERTLYICRDRSPTSDLVHAAIVNSSELTVVRRNGNLYFLETKTLPPNGQWDLKSGIQLVVPFAKLLSEQPVGPKDTEGSGIKGR
jgi:hypothetical protein